MTNTRTADDVLADSWINDGGHGELDIEFPDHTHLAIGLEQIVPDRQ